MTHRWFIHAKSEREAEALAALGWKCDPAPIQTHHQEWSVRYSWEGEGTPQFPQRTSAATHQSSHYSSDTGAGE